MHNVVALPAIAVIWVYGWQVGLLWVKGCGVRERISRWALACIVPTAGLIVAVHLLAIAAMVAQRGLVTPVSVAMIFAVLCRAGHAFVATQLPASPQTLRPGIARPAPVKLGVWWVPIVAVAGMYVVFLVDAVTGYPTGHDTLHYHLPAAVHWMRHGALHVQADLLEHSMHENGMIVPFLLAFARLEHLFTIVHLPKALVVGATMFGLARLIGVSVLGSTAAVCVALSVPMVVFQSFSGYVDLYATASWLSALLAIAWAMRVPRDRQRRNLILLAGLSAGVALGAKTTFLIMTAMLALIVLAEGWLRPQEGRTLAPRPVGNAVLFGVATLACSGFWFVRGAVTTGNPLYPVTVTIAGTQLLPGVDFKANFPQRGLARVLGRWWDYPWRERKNSGAGPNPGYPYSRNNAMGAAYATFVPLGCLAALLAALKRRPRTPEEKWRILFVVLAASAVILVPAVFLEMLRYALPLILVAVPVAAVLVDRLTVRFPRSVVVTLTAALAVTAAIATLKPAQSFLGRVRDGRWDRAWFYQIPPVVDSLGSGAKILNLSAPSQCYPLLGKHLGNVVVSTVQWRALTGSEALSVKALREHAIDYVFVHEPWPTDWPAGMPVDLIHDDTETRALKTTPAARL
ncbi:MAG: hypothetical protein JSV19_03060, partial [Phycisphaerales bacterium]